MQRVVVVDDDAEVVDLVVTILREEGYAVTGFTSAEAGRSAIITDRPALALLDVLMPDGNGVDLCRTLRADERTRPVKVVFLSGDGHLREEAGLAAADGYIVKPFDLDHLIRLTRSLIGPSLVAVGLGEQPSRGAERG